MIIAGVLISGLYVLLMFLLISGQARLKPFVFKQQTVFTQFSVIVPFRDEADNLEDLLHSFSKLDYPEENFEIILINDFSSDNFEPIIEKYKKILPNLYRIDSVTSRMAPKKAALTLGISKAQYDWIVTTDADCTFSKNWLQTYNQKIIDDKPLLIAGLVKFNNSKSFLNRFQCLDLLSLQATLLGSFGWQKPLLCHGANLCYAKSLFYELNGFKNHQNIASGDDVFLLESALEKHPEKIAVLNSLEAVVSTTPEPTLKALLAQRTRWAAKAVAYKSRLIKIVGSIVFAMNVFLVLGFFLNLIGLFPVKLFWVLFLIKFNTDAVILYRMTVYFKQEKIFKSYMLSSFLYPIFSVTSVLLGLTKGFTWKERKFKI